jgi:NAD(P)-dependent dehydrogenase (short-subunit alcohol dehydrogenase family)
VSDRRSLVVIGGTSGIGLRVAQRAAARGDDVVISGRDADGAQRVAKELGGQARGIGVDIAHPAEVADRLSGIERVDHLVIAAIERDMNTAAEYDVPRATYLATLKLVGYTAVVSALRERLADDASVVLFGGMAKERPYPGSTTVTTVNGGVVGLTRTLVEELRPIRVNSIHPGVVGDSPYWSEKPAAIEKYASETPLGRLVTMSEIVSAVVFLLENGGVNGVDLIVDGGWHCR